MSRKTTDFMTNHPEYSGKATRCGRPTLLVIQAFISRPAEMFHAAQAIEDGIESGELFQIPPQPDEVDETGISAVEGRLLARRALTRERNPRLRALKIRHVLRQDATLRCEVCAFSFTDTYGELGKNYIEVHHITPLHASGSTETQLADLACLCANCHRMCHRARPGESWRTPAALRELLRKATGRTDGC
ncbi:HNH endonuclease [Streptomyces olivaceus]|uniref:HNH endonuclease n=1 Tax=Streptomyces olivaceus TaxID=47716 RepID=UPI001CCACE1A|nr:HNH endonuclease [Streptomyces olivaceus]